MLTMFGRSYPAVSKHFPIQVNVLATTDHVTTEKRRGINAGKSEVHQACQSGARFRQWIEKRWDHVGDFSRDWTSHTVLGFLQSSDTVGRVRHTVFSCWKRDIPPDTNPSHLRTPRTYPPTMPRQTGA